jgi:hypothetical protein
MKNKFFTLIAFLVIAGNCMADDNEITKYFVKVGATGSGSSWDEPMDLVTALRTSSLKAGDEIYVAAGTYNLTEGQLISGQLSTYGNVAVNVYGGYPADATGTEAEKPTALPDFETNPTIITRESTITNNSFISITGGSWERIHITGVNGGGGSEFWRQALRIQGGSLKYSYVYENTNCGGAAVHVTNNGTVEDCEIYDNTAMQGGGINLNGGTILNCKVYGNEASQQGGGIYGSGSALIDNCSVYNNTSATGGDGSGGGVYLSSSDVTLKNSYIYENNTTSQGGGAYCNGGTIDNCEIYQNSTSISGDAGGGGVAIQSGILKNSIIRNNEATNSAGGGILVTNDSKVINCTIDANHSFGQWGGGGVRAKGSSETVNCLITNNSTVWGGGGITADDNSKVINCTVVGNSSSSIDSYAGGIAINGNVTVANSIVWGNTDISSGSEVSSDISTPWGGGSTIKNTVFATVTGNIQFNGIDNSNSDPELTGKYRLKNESPAIGAGSITDYLETYPETDLAGRARIREEGTVIDMGAYSYLESITVENEDVEIENDATYEDIFVKEGVTLTVSAGIHAGTITVEAGGKLTLSENANIEAESLTLTGNPTDGMATFIDERTSGSTIVAEVKQTLSTASSRKWYYLASPIDGAFSDLFNEGDKIGYYDESEGDYTEPFDESTPLVSGKGYAIYMAATTDPTYIFNGALNNGEVSVPLTRTADKGKGFNLIGNPYPSYLDWDAVGTGNDNVESTIWTRTFDADANAGNNMVFKTYNADSQVGTDDQTTAHIAPLQAFWVRVPEGSTSTTLVLTNDFRSHKAEGDSNLRVGKQEPRQLLRLQVSNGTNRDNAVILFDDRADDGFDRYDSEKMSNNNAAIPEIYTLAGMETVAINTLPGVAEGRELPLGFKTGTAGTFDIGIHSSKNLENVDVILIDNTTRAEFDLTAGSYEFTSDITDTADRFTLAFRAPTGLQNAGNPSVSVYAKDRRIVVTGAGAKAASHVQVFNTIGQKLTEQALDNETTVIDRTFEAGIYLVKINGETRKIAVK